MMKIIQRSTGSIAILLSTLLTMSTAATAGAEEDYQQGATAYQKHGDMVGAISPLTRAADAGHIEAQLLLGYILDWSEENQRSVHYYRMAADAGDPRGQLALAHMYTIGEGVDKDPAMARNLIEKARDLGHAPALTRLGFAHLNGTLGFERDLKQARMLFQQALDTGDKKAEEGLAAVDKAEAEQQAKAQQPMKQNQP